MKAVLKFVLGTKNLDLEKMDLFDLDQYLMDYFDDSEEFRLNGKYYDKIKKILDDTPDRSEYKHPNGSIRMFLENDDGTPIKERRVFNKGTDNEYTDLVQKQIRVLFGKDRDNYTRYGMNNLLILYYQNNPIELKKFMGKLLSKLYNDNYDKDNIGLNDVVDFNTMIEVQRCMFGNAKSLYTDKRPNIEDRRRYDKSVMDFVHSLNFNNLGDLYLDIREDAARQADSMNLKPKKVPKCPEVKEKNERELISEKMFGRKTKWDKFKQEMIIDDYLKLQEENEFNKELESMGERYYKK